MSGHRFGGTNRNFVGVFAEHLFDRAGFANVTDIGRGGMCVNVIDLFWRYPRMLERHLHGAHGTVTICRWCGHMISIRRKSVTGEFAVNLRTSRLSMFEFFHHYDSCAFAHDKAVAVAVERSRSAFGLVVARAK